MNTEHVRKHYDASVFQSQEDRANGPLYKLKKYHNTIKRDLLMTYAKNAGSLLDLCCGRGGDLQKWNACRVKYVRGLDLSPVEIQEAQRRYATLQKKNSTSCYFQVADLTRRWETFETYDVVTAMFCLHYFFHSAVVLGNFLDTVACALKPGGYFIGIAPRDTRVLAAPNTEYLQVTLVENTTYDVFGREYVFSLRDTVTAAHDVSKGSVEYLVNFEVLESMAAMRGLELVTTTPVVPPEEYPGYEASVLFESFVFVRK